MKQILPIQTLALTLAVLFGTAAFGAAVETSEADLIRRALDSQQAIEARVEACRSLQLRGGAAAANTLGALLAEPSLHFAARSALEINPDSAATRALQMALVRTTEKALVIGLLNSLGERRDPTALAAIAGKLADGDAAVRSAALRSLGKLGTVEALRALEKFAPQEAERATHEAALIVAASTCATNDPRAAGATFRRLGGAVSPATRGAALVGLGRLSLLTVDEWRGALQSPERALRQAAVALAAQGTGDAFVPTAAVMAAIPAEVQEQLIAVLGAREARAALPAIRHALRVGEARVRAAAARVLGEMGDAESADALFAIAWADDEPGAGARAGLARLPGRKVDERLMERFSKSEGEVQARVIEVLTTRGFAPLVGSLLNPTLLESPTLLRATTEALRSLARVEDFGAVLAFALRLPPDQRGAIAGVLGHIIRRTDDSGEVLKKCDEALRAAEPATVASMLPLYSVAQGPEAVAALAPWVRHESRPVRVAAVQALGRWDSGGCAELLLETAEKHPDVELRGTALRSLATVLRKRNAFRETAPVLGWLRRGLAVAEAVEDKKTLLGVVAIYRGGAAKNIVEQYRTDPAVAAEAERLLGLMR